MAAIQYPLINGVRYDHSSHDIRVAGVSIIGVTSLDYSDSLEPGEASGTSPQLTGRTRGIYRAQASIEFLRAEYDQQVVPAILAKRAFANQGLYEISFNIDVHLLPEGGLAMVTDNIVGCRIKSPQHSTASGSQDPTKVKCDLHVMYMVKNGVSPITNLRR